MGRTVTGRGCPAGAVRDWHQYARLTLIRQLRCLLRDRLDIMPFTDRSSVPLFLSIRVFPNPHSRRVRYELSPATFHGTLRGDRSAAILQ